MIQIDSTLSYYLANMGREVPLIKMPLVSSWFWVIDPKCYTFFEPLLNGERKMKVGDLGSHFSKWKITIFLRKHAIFDPLKIGNFFKNDHRD